LKTQNRLQGSYSFITPEGEQISVSYTADETGFHPSGLPPMPPHVQRLLDHLAKVE
jgi:loricrin